MLMNLLRTTLLEKLIHVYLLLFCPSGTSEPTLVGLVLSMSFAYCISLREEHVIKVCKGLCWCLDEVYLLPPLLGGKCACVSVCVCVCVWHGGGGGGGGGGAGQ